MAHDCPDYAALIRQRGFRFTSQRQLILEALSHCGGHVLPEAVYAWVRQKAAAVNRATIYRDLDFLCQMRLAVMAEIDGHRVYEIAGETPHHHLICRKCGTVMQIDHTMLKTLFAKVERECQFLIDTNHLALLGVCQKCRKD